MTSRLHQLLRASLPAASLCLAVVACKATRREPAAILSRPVGQLTRADLEPVCARLGWESDGVTSASHGAAMQIAARCSRESAQGIEGPDHKKREHLLVEVDEDRAEGMDRITSRLKGQQAAYRIDGGRAIGVSLAPGTREQAETILVRLLGK